MRKGYSPKPTNKDRKRQARKAERALAFAMRDAAIHPDWISDAVEVAR